MQNKCCKLRAMCSTEGFPAAQMVSFDPSDSSWKPQIRKENPDMLTNVLLYPVRGQKKCAPGLPEDRRRPIGCRASRFLPPDQEQEGEHGQVCQSLQPQGETAVHVQVRAIFSLFFFFLAQIKSTRVRKRYFAEVILVIHSFLPVV